MYVHNPPSIVSFSTAIKAINMGSGVNYLNFYYEGVRIDLKSGKVMHKHNPAKPIWREGAIMKRLHLFQKNKAKVATMAAKLFKCGLTNLGIWNQKRSSQ
jgi:hypothetical protein